MTNDGTRAEIERGVKLLNQIAERVSAALPPEPMIVRMDEITTERGRYPMWVNVGALISIVFVVASLVTFFTSPTAACGLALVGFGGVAFFGRRAVSS